MNFLFDFENIYENLELSFKEYFGLGTSTILKAILRINKNFLDNSHFLIPNNYIPTSFMNTK